MKKKPQFKLQTKVGQTVYRIEVNMRAGYSSSTSYKDGIWVETFKIGYQTNRKIALNNEYMMVLDRQHLDERKESYKNFLEDISVSVKTKETFWPNGVFCLCYTLENPEKTLAKMKRKMIEKINNEYGFLRHMNIEAVIEKMQIQHV